MSLSGSIYVDWKSLSTMMSTRPGLQKKKISPSTAFDILSKHVPVKKSKNKPNFQEKNHKKNLLEQASKEVTMSTKSLCQQCSLQDQVFRTIKCLRQHIVLPASH